MYGLAKVAVVLQSASGVKLDTTCNHHSVLNEGFAGYAACAGLVPMGPATVTKPSLFPYKNLKQINIHRLILYLYE